MLLVAGCRSPRELTPAGGAGELPHPRAAVASATADPPSAPASLPGEPGARPVAAESAPGAEEDPELGVLPEEAHDQLFASVGALCNEFIQRSREDERLPALAKEYGLKPRRPSCFQVPHSVPFTPSGTYRALHALKMDNGLNQTKVLAIETSEGVAMTPARMALTDLFDPGCPSILRERTFESAAVDKGHLVIVMNYERSTWVEPVDDKDMGYRNELVRGAIWGRPKDGKLVFGTIDLQSKPALGHKLQPSSTPRPWSSIPWTGERGFAVSDDGRLVLVPKP